MTEQSALELERFRDLVAERLGLAFDDGKLGLLREVLARRLGRLHATPGEYLRRFERRDLSGDEVSLLAPELTVTETYFFRHGDQLRAFGDLALRARARKDPGTIRILCAGCASGEEAYSLAMLARESLVPEDLALITFVAVDVNRPMLEKARRARYSPWSLRETPLDVRARWFHREGSEFALHPDIQRLVTFEERNLSEDDPLFWRSEVFDVVMCRNVIMYFTPEAARALVRRIAESLAPGGLLFLGHAETLRALSRDFHLCHTHDTFYYRRRDTLVGPNRFVPAPSSSALAAEDKSWFDAIRHSARRVHSLTEPRPSDENGSSAPDPVESWDAALAARLIHEERFEEAKSLLGAAPKDLEHDPDTLLLRAVLLTHGGDVAAAEVVCRKLLDLDVVSPGGHYLMALCRESVGDREGAADQNLIAAHADPSFALPRLHLGLLARRTGDLPAARREFARALTLLEREDLSRLLLFGGGFSREALIDLCRAELVACGGAS